MNCLTTYRRDASEVVREVAVVVSAAVVAAAVVSVATAVVAVVAIYGRLPA